MIKTILKRNMRELGIVDTRNIISAIIEKYNYDFSDYALISFKRRLERIIDNYNLKYPDVLVSKLTENDSFFDTFLFQLSVPSTEMFRDPSLWRILRDDLIPNIYRESGSGFKIWLPNSVSGDELFSLAIMLHEMGLLEKVQIIVSSLSETGIETIKSGIFQNYKLEISNDNYIRANGKNELSNYFTSTKDNNIKRDVSLIKNVVFFKQNVFLEPAPQNVKIVMFRNKMIYFNQTLQGRVLKTLYHVMATGSYLVVGTKESLNPYYGSSEFISVSKTESIYKAKI
jgi:chemotaxis protein methyltransferase CheR